MSADEEIAHYGRGEEQGRLRGPSRLECTRCTCSTRRSSRLDDPVRRGVLMRAIARVEAEPALVGASPHMLALATRA